jgi:hypothetical protein
MRSRIEPVKEDRPFIAPTSRADPQLLLGSKTDLQRRGRRSNNKTKVTMRKSYDFRTFRTLEPALYYSLGKLPEPESTHDFF